jgi:hypothetical protein
MDSVSREVTTPCHLHMKGICVNFAVHSYRANTELFRCANDTTRDFPSVRQLEHASSKISHSLRTCSR